MALVLDGTNGVSGVDGTASNPSYEGTDSNTGVFFPAADTVAIGTGGTERLRVDSAGNAGLGVTPSAWGTASGQKAFQIGTSGFALSSSGAGAGDGSLTWNGYYNGTNWIYSYTGGAASRFRLNESGAAWFTAASGTAGNAITFTQAMTLDASGNLMVGGTTARGMLTIGGNSTRYFTVGDTGVATLRFDDNGTPAFNLLNYGITGANQGYQLRWQLADAAANFAIAGSIAVATEQAWTSTASTQDAYMQFAVALNGTNTERARITSGGDWLVGTTTNGGVGWTFEAVGYSITKKSGTATTVHISFQNNNGEVGKISTSGTATTYGTSSDYRLKENVQPMSNALAKVAELKPVTYKWKVDGSDGQGFIAHELQSVCPDAVIGEKDAVETYIDDSGTEQTRPVYQAVDTSFLIATLTAAIQELNAKVEAQAAEIAALKGNA